ncbi:MAG: ROK family protein [Nanoarchaeota archaeon]
MNLCLDIGATNIRIAEVEGAKIKNYQKQKTPRTKRELVSVLIKIISQYKNYSNICIATAGFEQEGKIHGAINFPYFNNTPLKSILRKKFNVPVYIQNDARCAALAELNLGSGKKFNNFVLLTLGTGIGGAIIINKKLYLGKGTAGEIGSMFIEHKKIFEHLASGNASLKIAEKLGFKKITSLELEELAKKGNKKAISVYNQVGFYLGIGLADLSYALSPDAFVIGGGFSRVKFIFPEAIKTLNSSYHISPKPKLVKAKFGDDAGLIGASLLTKSNL